MSIADVYLLQRASYLGKKENLDKSFNWDYMGSSEFEWGTLPRSIKAMRLFDKLSDGLVVKKIKRGDKVLWFMGPKDRLIDAEQVFVEELRPRGQRPRRKEATGMAGAYGLKDSRGKVEYDYSGSNVWIAVSDRFPQSDAFVEPRLASATPFVIATKKEAVKTFLELLRARKVAS